MNNNRNVFGFEKLRVWIAAKELTKCLYATLNSF